jgi:hypothetical protein
MHEIKRFDEMDSRVHRRQSDKLEALRDVFDIYTTHCIENYAPRSHVTTDEQVVSLQERFCGYMTSKPVKYGMKIWTIADMYRLYVFNQQVIWER